MTQAAKDRKGPLTLGAARGDFSKGRKASTKTGMYWVRPHGFLVMMASSSPSAASSSPSSCKQNHQKSQQRAGLARRTSFRHCHVLVVATYLLQPPPDVRLLVHLGLQHLLLLAGQLHLLFNAFLLLYLLKDRGQKPTLYPWNRSASHQRKAIQLPKRIPGHPQV